MENRNWKSSCCGNDDLVDAAVWTECLRAAVDFLTLSMRQYNRIPSYLISSIQKVGSVRTASGHAHNRQCASVDTAGLLLLILSKMQLV